MGAGKALARLHCPGLEVIKNCAHSTLHEISTAISCCQTLSLCIYPAYKVNIPTIVDILIFMRINFVLS